MKKEKVECPECGRKMKKSRKFKDLYICKRCYALCTKAYLEEEKKLSEKLLKKLDKIILSEINKN